MVHFEACDNQLMLIFGSHGKFFIQENIWMTDLNKVLKAIIDRGYSN